MKGDQAMIDDLRSAARCVRTQSWPRYMGEWAEGLAARLDGYANTADQEQPRSPLAEHLRLIANDLRAAGDIPLVRLSEDGVTQDACTLADELWLIALQVDGHMASEERGDG